MLSNPEKCTVSQNGILMLSSHVLASRWKLEVEPKSHRRNAYQAFVVHASPCSTGCSICLLHAFRDSISIIFTPESSCAFLSHSDRSFNTFFHLPLPRGGSPCVNQ